MSKSIQVMFNEWDYGLDEDQQNFVLDNHLKMPLEVLAQKAHKNPKIDGRAKETKNIKLFILKMTRHNSKPQVELSEGQREEIRKMAVNMKPMEIARVLFQNDSLPPLSNEVKTVDKFIKISGIDNEFVDLRDSGDYIAPKALSRIILKVNKAKADLNLREDTLTGLEKKFLENLRVYLNSPRFLCTINAINKQDEKELFESEFIMGVYGKDLNSEDINMYISLCMDYVQQKQIKAQLDSINEDIEDSMTDDDKSLKMTMVEAYGKKSDELDKCAKRIKSLQEALSQNYSKRLGDKATLSSSLVAFVELWKNQVDRQRMIMIAEARKTSVKEEIDKIESEADYIAKVMGISREELLNG